MAAWPYNTARWQKERKTFLSNNPLCKMCSQVGKITAADTVDHIIPHKGDSQLAWDQTNWQALCSSCHSRHKQRQEKSGHLAGCDEDGWPLDPSHLWNGA